MELQTLLNQLQTQKDEVLSRIEGSSWESIRHRPSSEEWSAIEVLDHLVRTEVEILATAQRGLLKPHRIGVADRLRTRFIQAVFRSDRKVRVPSTATQVLPGTNLELPGIAQRWNDCRRELTDLVETTTAAHLNKGIFRHPVGGWMGIPEILNFFSVHITHHNHQLARLRKQKIHGTTSASRDV